MYETTYHRASSRRRSRRLFAKGTEAKYLAGGQTLLPVMKQRLAAPIRRDRSRARSRSWSASRSTGDTRDHQGGDHALRRRHSDAVKKAIPALAYLASLIGDPAVRYRGTIGGSIANNDPAADYPAAVLALGATVKTNKRTIAADDFFKGLFTTALADGEIITAVSFPVPAKAGYAKIPPPCFALCADRRVRRQDQGRRRPRRRHRRLAERRYAGRPDRGGAEGELVGGRDRQRQISAAGLLSDIHGSADYRANLVKVMAQRAVTAAG